MNIDSFKPQLLKLFTLSVENLLPSPEIPEPLSNEEISSLIGLSSLLSLSEDGHHLSLSYEIITRLVECSSIDESKTIQAADIILSRIGNFPGRKLLRDRYKNLNTHNAPLSLSLERIAREIENSVEDIVLTDFQHRLYVALDQQKSLSVSAPTSAGKSFILNLDLTRRLKSGKEKCLIYIVPTRALISEVSNRIRSTIKDSKLQGIIVRTAPFPPEPNISFDSIIYVLTPERLLSLLKPQNNKLPITSIFVDEAHEIQKGKRGITLQNAVDLSLSKHPNSSVLFASPLISNPGYFLGLFGRQDNGQFFTETVSPVSQNLILVSEVHKAPRQISVSLIAGGEKLDLGARPVDFRLRDSKARQKAYLADAITKNQESTIIFANGPGDAEDVVEELKIICSEAETSEELQDFINFIKSEIHEEHPLIESLPKGIAFHYGDMPSIVRSGIENFFRNNELRFLCCTSTLLQGVNLPAKHIVIENPYSGKRPMNRSDFLNLAGRAGRLLHEFHGNIWCLRPGEWKEDSYQGDQLQKIESSMSKIMDDGGTLIHELLSGKTTEEITELAEASFSRLFHESNDLTDDELHEKYKTTENQENLKVSINLVRSLEITLPSEILESHSTLRPDHLQDLYNKFRENLYIEELTLINPFTTGGKSRMAKAVDIISEAFEWEMSQRYRNWICTLAHQWVTGKTIGEFLKERVNFKRRDDNNTQSASSIIRELLGIIEKDIRYKLVKYFSAYEDILTCAQNDRGIPSELCKQAPYHTFLEFGSCIPIELSLMSLGFSRFTAHRLRNQIDWGDAKDIEDYIDILKSVNLERLSIPKICKREIRDLLA